MASTMGRAKRGGETGKNGEFYEGGKFLPSTTQPKRRGSVPSRARRAEVEPGMWAEAPEGKWALWESIKALVDHAVRQSNPSAPLRPIQNQVAIEYYGGQAVLDRIESYNRGERWFTVRA